MHIGVNFIGTFWQKNNCTKACIEEILNQNSDDTFDFFVIENIDIQNDRAQIYNFSQLSPFKKFVSLHSHIFKKKYDSFLHLGDGALFTSQKNIIFLIPTLDILSYPDFHHTKILKKYIWMFQFKYMLQKANKILCFTYSNKQELNEKLNISEEKINIIPAFFPQVKHYESQVHIKNKHHIQNDYIIFDGEIGKGDNIKKVFLVIKDLLLSKPISLIILGNHGEYDFTLRQEILSVGIEKNVIFAGVPSIKERKNYYDQSLGVISPGLYNHFPFHLTYALHFQTPIFASHHDEIKKIFGDSIKYFSPLSQQSISDCIKTIPPEKTSPEYTQILQNFSLSHTISSLHGIYKNIS